MGRVNRQPYPFDFWQDTQPTDALGMESHRRAHCDCGPLVSEKNVAHCDGHGAADFPAPSHRIGPRLEPERSDSQKGKRNGDQ